MASDVANAVEQVWEKEDILDADLLYMRVHFVNIYDDGTPKPAAFKDHGEGMSTDWQKYSTPEQTRNRVLPDKDPMNYEVISMIVSGIRAISILRVEHTPLPGNRAHTDVFGDKKGGDPEARVLLRRLAQIEIAYTRPA